MYDNRFQIFKMKGNGKKVLTTNGLDKGVLKKGFATKNEQADETRYYFCSAKKLEQTIFYLVKIY